MEYIQVRDDEELEKGIDRKERRRLSFDFKKKNTEIDGS